MIELGEGPPLWPSSERSGSLLIQISYKFFPRVSPAAQPTCRHWWEGGRVRVSLGLCWGDEQQRAQHAGPDPSGCSGHPHPPLSWKPSAPRPQQGRYRLKTSRCSSHCSWQTENTHLMFYNQCEDTGKILQVSILYAATIERFYWFEDTFFSIKINIYLSVISNKIDGWQTSLILLSPCALWFCNTVLRTYKCINHNSRSAGVKSDVTFSWT